ncbi:retrovirus-related pol polyprotein from transposon tnt 1-94 [Cucumis melo var. makuwa]|uniref:Retrovirus-related pol polyprotein from transposon tnt 1-94 n=1 Tax=Cucumis melo var. makuwa TaxID=1194695 RepID=A0A5D3DIL5_CUCMM|nr:retrovirus-related pol polyprotein from transposon tnt 1-94 [Cucumis melo var. makuwa]
MSDVLAKKHESLATAKESMDSLKGMFEQPGWSLRHEVIKYIYTKCMKEDTSVREHVLDMMMHFNIAEGEITLKVGTGEMVSAKAVEDSKIGRLVKNGLLSQLEDNSLPLCDFYLEGKMTKRSFTGKGLRAKTPLELVHSDLCGPMNVKVRGGYEYFISFIDDYSRYGHVYLIQNKSDSFEKFKEHKTEVQNEIEDPLTYKQAMNDVDCDQWIKAMDLEMESMYSNFVWTLVDQPNDMDVKTTFLNGNLEESIYMVQLERIINSTVAFLVLYVDDILLLGNDVGHLADIKKWLATQFQMKDLGNAQYVLQFQKGSAAMQIWSSFIKRKMSKETSRIGIVSRYHSNLGRDHWTAVKNILKYLRRTKDYMLTYGSKDLILIGYTDSDFQTDKDARKSTSGSVFTLNGGVLVWRSIKQSSIADSTMEAEYVAACEAAKEVLQIHENLEVINEENTLNENTILSGKSYIEETLQ